MERAALTVTAIFCYPTRSPLPAYTIPTGGRDLVPCKLTFNGRSGAVMVRLETLVWSPCPCLFRNLVGCNVLIYELLGARLCGVEFFNQFIYAHADTIQDAGILLASTGRSQNPNVGLSIYRFFNIILGIFRVMVGQVGLSFDQLSGYLDSG